MHEYSIVSSIVDSMLEAIRKQRATKVVSVHFRRGSAFSEEALRQAYDSLAKGTALEHAPVQVDTVNRHFKCRCGHEQIVTSDLLRASKLLGWTLLVIRNSVFAPAMPVGTKLPWCYPTFRPAKIAYERFSTQTTAGIDIRLLTAQTAVLASPLSMIYRMIELRRQCVNLLCVRNVVESMKIRWIDGFMRNQTRARSAGHNLNYGAPRVRG